MLREHRCATAIVAVLVSPIAAFRHARFTEPWHICSDDPAFLLRRKFALRPCGLRVRISGRVYTGLCPVAPRERVVQGMESLNNLKETVHNGDSASDASGETPAPLFRSEVSDVTRRGCS